MNKTIIYPSQDLVIEYNELALALINAKKSDKPEVLSYKKINHSIEQCKKAEGDLYKKSAILLKELIQAHAFASGNRRTAFIVTKAFLLMNGSKTKIKNDPALARVLLGIRENYYSDQEIKEWIKNGKIKPFNR